MSERKVAIPELSLVVLVGASGSGKSTFARKHFKETEIVSSDFYRGVVADDPNDQAASAAAFEVVHFVAQKRLAAGRLTVIDATNVQPEARKPLVELARKLHVLPVAVVLDVDDKLCRARNEGRPDRAFGAHVIRNQRSSLKRSLRFLRAEGFRHVFHLDGPAEIDAVTVERQPLWNNKRKERGPFDIIGDVHGCFLELRALLDELGYDADGAHPQGRRAVFVGDLVDRGPGSVEVLRLVMQMVARGSAFCVPGNHENKLKRWLDGKNVQLTHGLAETVAQVNALPDDVRDAFKQEVGAFIEERVSHYVFDDGNLVVAHAGLREDMQGRASGAVRSFAMYGETTGETDELGLPVRYDWAADYRGRAHVVYGHTPVPEAAWVNRTICIDTGCVFGGQLTALRWPEKDLVSVDAARMYYEPKRPLAPATSAASGAREGDLLDIADVDGKRLLTTCLGRNVTIRAENAAAALEVMSRFAVDPRWLVYLPPTMSPVEAQRRDGTVFAADLLEHPRDAFAYYADHGVDEVVCEEKHMGSRAVAVVLREPEARARFGFDGAAGPLGVIYTRTGRPFFADAALEHALLSRVRDAATAAGLWDELGTSWLALDCELLPWSAKAHDLVRSQYASVGAAARASLAAVVAALEGAAAQDGALLEAFRARRALAERYTQAYRRYCWDVAGVDDLKLAPFHLLASEGAAHVDKDHAWHMETLAELASPSIVATPYRVVNLRDAAAVDEAVAWWLALTERGGEGMVVKPRSFVARSKTGLVQPALKVRGREYLRIIYGPEYTSSLERLRRRGVGIKRSLALREFALGVEALARFVEREPLWRVHECVFGVLALESEPVDPRL